MYNDYLRAISLKRNHPRGLVKGIDYVGYVPNLGCAPKHVADQSNPMLGINVPCFDINTHLSFSCMHIEDQSIDSLHLIHAGSKDSGKIVLVFPLWETPECNSEVAKEIAYLRRSTNVRTEIFRGSTCKYSMQHRTICLDTTWLDKKKIAYSLVRLFLGDLLYTGPDMLYQELNFGFTIVESVDVGGNFWDSFATATANVAVGGGGKISYLVKF